MNRFVPIAALVAAASLAGCAAQTQQHVLDNLAGCDRTYDGTVTGGLTGGAFSGTVKIHCDPATAP